MIPVDLSEMAEFIAVVQNRFVFLTCVSRCQLQFVGQCPGAGGPSKRDLSHIITYFHY